MVLVPWTVRATTQPEASSWALKELLEGDKMGLYPMEYRLENMNFTTPLEKKEGEELYRRTAEKLKDMGITKIDSKEFIFQQGTRKEIMEALLNLYGEKSFQREKERIRFLQEKGILKGKGNTLDLEGVCSKEEAIALFTRTVKEMTKKNGLGAKGFLWSVEHRGQKIYLFGSIHMGKHRMYPIRSEVLEAFQKSEHIYFEVATEDEKEWEYMKKQMTYSDGRTLREDLGEKDYQSFVEIMDLSDIPEEEYKYYRPWAAYHLLSTNPENVTIKNYLGVDSYFMEKAKLYGKKIHQLESVKRQTDTLYDVAPEEYLGMIRQVLEEINQHGYRTLDDQIDTLQECWIQGDVKKINGYLQLEDTRSEEKVKDVLLGQRDIDFADNIEKILRKKGKKTSFVVIGAAHLTPKQSVVGLLKQRGYRVKSYQ